MIRKTTAIVVLIAAFIAYVAEADNGLIVGLVFSSLAMHMSTQCHDK